MAERPYPSFSLLTHTPVMDPQQGRIWEKRGAQFPSALRLPKLRLRKAAESPPRYGIPSLGMRESRRNTTQFDMAGLSDVDALSVKQWSPEAGDLSLDTPTFTVSELERISFDIDGGSPGSRCEASGLPRHATFDPVGRRFTWRPRPGQDGIWVISFAASRPNGEASTLTVRIRVRALADRLLSLIPKPIEL